MCLYGLVLVRVWFLLLMVLMLLSMLLLWLAPGLGGPWCSRLSVSDLGRDSSQESSTLELPSGDTLDTLVSLLLVTPVSSRCVLLASSWRETVRQEFV